MTTPPDNQPYDLFTSAFKSDPFPTFAQMRQDAPIYAHTAPNGETIWYITRYEDVTAVLKDDHNFCKDPRHAKDHFKQRRTEEQRLINENMLFADPPDHTRLRALINQAFTPRRIAAQAPRIQALADQLLDQITNQSANPPTFDLIADYALPIPVSVICDLLGIPPEDQAQVTDWSQAIIAPGRHGLNYSARRRKVRAFIDYLKLMFAARQANPQDDLITALVQAEEAGERLTEAELSSMVALLLVTGHETTVNLIGNGALALLQHPDQTNSLRENPARWEAAIEELLRYDGPVETSTTRWARQDVLFQGYPIKRGDVVRVVLTSANRDECQFHQPDRLNVHRTDNKHLAFGLGIHYCLGAPLARLEGKIGLQTLFQRLPNVRLAIPPEQLQWRSGVLFRGLELLPLVW